MLTITPLLFVLALASPQQPADVSAAVRATNELGIALFRALDKERPGKNLFVSPLSITIALAMLAEGARDETAAELREALHLDANAPLADVHGGFQALLAQFHDGSGKADPEVRARVKTLREQLAAAIEALDKLPSPNTQKLGELEETLRKLVREVDRYELRVADALWVDRRFTIAPEFAATLDRYYGSGHASPLDFANDLDGARRSISAWFAEQTQSVPELPMAAIRRETAIVLADAVHFSGEWDSPFAAEGTRDEEFRLADGSKAALPFMHDAKRYLRYGAFTRDGTAFRTPLYVPADETQRAPCYPDDGGFAMIELRYKGEELAMLVLAPRAHDGLPRLEQLLTQTSLTTWCDNLKKRTVDTAMLRFEQRGALELSAALQAIGVRRAFTPPPSGSSAQLHGLTTERGLQQRLFVDCVVHHAWVQVHEKGTEAVASIGVDGVSVGVIQDNWVPFTPVFRADRPFLFLVRDVKSGVILFLGRVTEPRT